MRDAIDRMVGKPGFAEAIHGVFSWFHSRTVTSLVVEKIMGTDAVCRNAALACCYLHQWGADDGIDDALLTKAFRPDVLEFDALAHCGKSGFARLPLEFILTATPDDPAFFNAARCALLLGERDVSVRALQACLTSQNKSLIDAAKLLCLALPLIGLQKQLAQFEKNPEFRGLLIQAVGWNGDPAYIPWLIAQIDESDEARLAGEAFRLVTGLDLVANQMVRNQPPPSRSAAQVYPMPDAAELTAWWQVNQHLYTCGTRYLLGRPPSEPWLIHILSAGEQAHRELAALHMTLSLPGKPHFPLHASAAIQLRHLNRIQGNDYESS